MRRIMCLVGATVLLLAGCSGDEATVEATDDTAASEQAADDTAASEQAPAADEEPAEEQAADDTAPAEGSAGPGQVTVDGTTYAITSLVACTIGSTTVAAGGTFDDGGGGAGFSLSSIEGEGTELTISMTSGSWSAEGDAIEIDADDDAGTITAQADITSTDGAASTATFEVTC